MKLRSMAAVAGLGLLAAGCSADGGLQTASINKPAEQAAVDPTCVALANQIDILRKEGNIEKLEQAATGKGASVKVKREALAKQAELNRVNADFQGAAARRCRKSRLRSKYRPCSRCKRRRSRSRASMMRDGLHTVMAVCRHISAASQLFCGSF